MLNSQNSIMLILPKTTPQQYLTGISALNLPSGLQIENRREVPISLQHEDPLNELLLASSNFDLGVFNCTEILDAHGFNHEEDSVWVATHARAIADMLLFSVTRNLSFDSILINEWTTWQGRLELMQIIDLELTLASPEHKQRILNWIGQKEDDYNTSVQALIAIGHDEDERRVRSGELSPDEMFFISRKKAATMTVVWNNDPSLFDEL